MGLRHSLSNDGLNKKIRKYRMNIILATLIVATAGSILQIGGTSWDVTSHLVRQPETFFTPSHTVLYAGVGLLTITSGIYGIIILKNKEIRRDSYTTAFKLVIVGSAVSLVAGPSDFLWHETFGVDGLLSPPHLALITGMLINAIAVVVGLARVIAYLSPGTKQRLARIALVPAYAALWFTMTWYVYMFSLPFSNGENFQFNLNPNLSTMIAVIALPMINSIIFVTASKTIGRFGAASTVAALVVCINILANIISTNGLISLLPIYLVVTIVSAIIGDIILNNGIIRSKIGVIGSELIVGALIGSMFYIFGYPMLTWAFVIPLHMQSINLQDIETVGNLTSSFQGTLQTVLVITLVPSLLMGIIGAFLSSKKLTLQPLSQLKLSTSAKKQDSNSII